MIITFPFIDRMETANKKTGRSKWLLANHRQILKSKCNFCVRLEMRTNKVESNGTACFYGAVLNRYWFFTDKRQRDYDNFCSGTKYYTDALVSEGLIAKDDCNHLLMGDVVFFDSQKSEKLVYVLDLFRNKNEFNEYKNRLHDGIQKKLEVNR